MTMSGKATAAEYESVIKSLQLKNVDGSDVAGDRVIRFSVINTDGKAQSGVKQYNGDANQHQKGQQNNGQHDQQGRAPVLFQKFGVVTVVAENKTGETGSGDIVPNGRESLSTQLAHLRHQAKAAIHRLTQIA